MKNKNNDKIMINEAQLILAEKRTSFAALRTGIAVFALPLTITSLLIVTSKYYDIVNVLFLFVIVAGICILLSLLGGYLIVKSVFKIHNYDKLLENLKKKNKILQQYLE